MFVLAGFAAPDLAALVFGGPALRLAVPIGLDGAPTDAVLVVFRLTMYVERLPALGFAAMCFPDLWEAASLPCRRDVVVVDRPIPTSDRGEWETWSTPSSAAESSAVAAETAPFSFVK